MLTKPGLDPRSRLVWPLGGASPNANPPRQSSWPKMTRPVLEMQQHTYAQFETYGFPPNPDSNGSASVAKAQVSPSRRADLCRAGYVRPSPPENSRQSVWWRAFALRSMAAVTSLSR